MRTTLTLDPDVAAGIERLRKEQDLSLKQVINDTLRAGLAGGPSFGRKSKPYTIKPVNLGRCLVGSFDDVSETLAVAEGDDYR